MEKKRVVYPLENFTSVNSQSTTTGTTTSTGSSSSSASSANFLKVVHAQPFVTPVRGAIKRRIFSCFIQKLQLIAGKLQETLFPCNKKLDTLER